MSQQDKKSISAEEIRGRLDGALDGLDTARAKGLERLLAVRKARHRALEKGLSRHLVRYGENDPGVQRLARRLERNRVAMEELRPVAAATRQPPPEVDDKRWLVRGNVLAADNAGIAGVTVVLVDRAGRQLRSSPVVETDRSGFYELELPATKTSDKEVYVQIRQGGKKRRLVETPLKIEPGGVELVVGYGIGVERDVPLGRKARIDEVVARGKEKAKVTRKPAGPKPKKRGRGRKDSEEKNG